MNTLFDKIVAGCLTWWLLWKDGLHSFILIDLYCHSNGPWALRDCVVWSILRPKRYFVCPTIIRRHYTIRIYPQRRIEDQFLKRGIGHVDTRTQNTKGFTGLTHRHDASDKRIMCWVPGVVWPCREWRLFCDHALPAVQWGAIAFRYRVKRGGNGADFPKYFSSPVENNAVSL